MRSLPLNQLVLNSRRRSGAIIPLFALILPVLAIIAAFTINIAYLQLTRTELMVATDAAARAGGRAISQSQSQENITPAEIIQDAITAAQATAALNTVAGVPLRLNGAESVGDIEFGDAEPDSGSGSDRFVFELVSRTDLISGNENASSIRINGRMTQGSLSGPVNAIFPTFGMIDQFDLNAQTVAMQVDRDIALILDRSGSMDEHPGYNWPPGFSPWDWDSMVAGYNAGILGYSRGQFYYRSGQNARTYQDFLYEDYLGLGEPPQTPWQELEVAVDRFLEVLETTDQEEQVSLASYSTEATLDLTLVKNYDLIRQKMTELYPEGWTAIGEGMREGIPSLLDSNARPFAAKTLLVMTDGIHNTGVDPVTVATEIVSRYDVTIHTITFGANADQATMQLVADIGGGEHYHAEDGEQLQLVMEVIANNLPTLVVK